MFTDLFQFGLKYGDPNVFSLGMEKHYHPWSITEEEFFFMRDYIIAHHYQSGYEVATAFGVSACAIGLGLKANQGKLVSVDAYLEEQVNLAGKYQTTHKEVNAKADGYQIALQLRKHFDLEDTIDFQFGWSPDDIPALLGDRQLDFVFIDAAHTDKNVLADVEVIKDRLTPACTVMLHDTYAFTPNTLSTISQWLGSPMVKPPLKCTAALGCFTREHA